MAGANTSVKGREPNRLWSAAQPDTTPGTVTEGHPSFGISLCPSRLRASASANAGAAPEAFSP